MNFDPFLVHLQTSRNCSPQTIKAYRSDLKLFGAFLSERSVIRISQIDHAVIGAYIESMRQRTNPRFGRSGLAESSIARRLAAISSYFEFTRGTNPKLRNPLNELSSRWQKNNEPKPVEEYTLDLLLASITNIRDRALFTLFLATGLRVSEMHQLNRDSIAIELDLDEEGKERIDEEGKERVTGCGEVVGKGNKRRKFYVDDATVETYAKYLDTRTDHNPALFLSERKQRMSVRAIQYTLGAWCRKIGFSNINVHRLRHTYATRLANANISSMVLKDLMGHSSFTTTQRYFKLTETTLARGYFSAMEYLRR
jgi:site-specific recombinase XerD